MTRWIRIAALCGLIGAFAVAQRGESATSGDVQTEIVRFMHEEAASIDESPAGLRSLRTRFLAWIRAGVDLNVRGKDGSTLVHAAASIVDPSGATLVQLLMDGGASPHISNNAGDAPIHRAAESGSWRSVELLARAGVDVSRKGSNGLTPLESAAQSISPQAEGAAVAALVMRGADPFAPDARGWAPVHHLALGHPSQTILFIRALGENRGLDWNLRTPHGYTALMLAAVSGDPTERMRVLRLQNGLDVNDASQDGTFGIYAAMGAQVGEWESVSRVWTLLMIPEVEIDAKTPDGKTAYDLLDGRDDADARAIRALIETARKGRARLSESIR